MKPANDHLGIHVESCGGGVDFRSFLAVGEETLGILEDIDASISGRPSPVLKWEIVKVHMDRPLSMTIMPEATAHLSLAPEVIQSYTEGLRAIEENGSAIPPHFSRSAMDHVTRLASILSDGTTKLTFIPSNGAPVSPSQRLAANTSALTATGRKEIGSVEGKLQMLSVHAEPIAAIWEALSGVRVECHLPESLVEEAKKHLGKRVIVSGMIHDDKMGKRAFIKVEKLRALRAQSELPQFKDIEGVDITGGEDAVAYIRRMRDA